MKNKIGDDEHDHLVYYNSNYIIIITTILSS